MRLIRRERLEKKLYLCNTFFHNIIIIFQCWNSAQISFSFSQLLPLLFITTFLLYGMVWNGMAWYGIEKGAKQHA